MSSRIFFVSLSLRLGCCCCCMIAGRRSASSTRAWIETFDEHVIFFCNLIIEAIERQRKSDKISNSTNWFYAYTRTLQKLVPYLRNVATCALHEKRLFIKWKQMKRWIFVFFFFSLRQILSNNVTKFGKNQMKILSRLESITIIMAHSVVSWNNASKRAALWNISESD